MNGDSHTARQGDGDLDDASSHDHAVDTGTIAWLLPELSNAFDAAIAALRSFRGGAAGMDRSDVDLAPLRVARSHLHQAHGALEIAEIAGVAKITEAIEELTATFEHAPERCDASALDAIVGGARAVIEYLEDLQNGARQQPLHLYPSYRDLLVARGVERIHPADLFHADLSLRAPRKDAGAQAALGPDALGNHRRAFEQALLRYLRSATDTEALQALSRAVADIEASVARDARQPQQRAFWWVARALFEALAAGGFGPSGANDAALKRVVGRNNLQIRKLVEGSTAVAERLFIDTLYFVATAAPVTPHVREVQAHYHLVGAIPKDLETQRYGRVDSSALRHAREVLADAKAAWSSVVAGDATQLPQFTRGASALVNAVGPLKQRGLAQLAQVIDGIATDLGFDPRRPSPSVGLDVATALLFIEDALDRARALDEAFDTRAAMVVARVEASVLGQESADSGVEWLDRIARQAEERLTMATFVSEMQANLRSAEKQLDGFFRDPTVRDGLREADASLAQVSGALALLGHDEPHRVIDAARGTIGTFQREAGATDPATFARIAQNLGAVGFYVDQIKRDRFDASVFHFDAENETFSADMARPLAQPPIVEEPAPEATAGPTLDLLFGPAPAPEVEGLAPAIDPGEPEHPAFASTEVMEPEPTAEEEMALRSDEATLLFADLRMHPEDGATRQRLVDALEEVRRTAVLIDDRALQDEASAALKTLKSADRDGMSVGATDALAAHVAELSHRASRAAGHAASTADLTPSAPVLSEEHADEIDAELLEIFLEEATTVLSDARESLRVLDADPSNVTAITVLRRGFHTLKGSGRMVGLMALGDAAWAIEDTLNGYLAEQAPAPTDLRALIDYAIRYMEDWVAELTSGRRSTRIAETLVDAAHAVRIGATRPTAPAVAKLVVPRDERVAADPILFDTPVDVRDAGDASVVEAEPDYQATELFKPAPTADDPHFAATQFIGGDDVLPDIEFFGEQPAHREDATRIIEELVQGDPGFAPAADGTPSDDDADFAKTLLFADLVDEGTAAHTPDAAGDIMEALLFDDGVGQSGIAEPRAERVADVEPVASDEPARVEETRRIGSLTLSVALFNIYLSEADELLRVLTQDFAEWRHELDRYVSEASLRAAHSLAGSSSTVGLEAAHDLAAAVEDVLLALFREPVVLSEKQVMRLQDAVEALSRMLHRFAAERMPDPEPTRVADLIALRREIAGGELSATLEGAAEEHAPETSVIDVSLLESSSEASSVDAGDGVTTVSERPDEVFADAVPEVEPTLASASLADLEELADTTAAAEDEPLALDFGIDEPVPSASQSEPEAVVEPAPDPVAEAVDEIAPALDDVGHEAPVDTEEAFATDQQLSAALMPAASAATAVEHAVRDDIDPDLIEVFTAEASEILPQIGAELRQWQANPTVRESARLLLRHLHTLKGSARMAGAMRLGEVVHDLEARVEAAARLHEVPASLLDELLAAHDRSLELFDNLQKPQEVEAPVAPTTSEDFTVTSLFGDQTKTAEALAASESHAPADAGRARDKAPAQQAVRVNTEVLDRLVNLAGEVSISRARIQNEVTQIKGSLSELSDNVERLRSQLREIEMQAEFQLQSQMQSQQAGGAEREKFDPLEFDRYTRFQELTRMMAESVNDVKTLQQNLQKSVENTETDLASQRRMTRDLQQDLMGVRMVPFSNVAERLYRVARRAAKEVDKRVNLDIRGGSVEIDRGVLERMAGPFEHMLRNHIVHGIESRAARVAAGKDETGELLVEVRQEGNEMVLTFSDDGAGLDLDRIRAKAREQGLVDANETIGDARAAEFIFHPGFSTAAEVTELAGRGVGMDVVRAEAVLLAGRVSVDSEKGRGTRFTINLPLTLAVTQVVLVRVAGHTYALPAVLVEQVQQLRPQPLADAYRAGSLEWAGEKVRMVFLGSLLAIDDNIPMAQRVSPVLILRSGGDRVAVHVDEVVGNQEVVVKNLGPQLARMTGIAGATILGSGAIVLILNPVQLAQVIDKHEPASVDVPVGLEGTGSSRPDASSEGALRTLPTVMVVDDSLTVRRVTQRLLSREGYQVVLAKDGVDALEQLQDYPPDAMLVDIEMPRMDGFDLTRNVRNDERLKHIPIIMITSRTAEKHRQHAASLGVDEYLGKPYQEDELLELLARHVRARRSQPA